MGLVRFIVSSALMPHGMDDSQRSTEEERREERCSLIGHVLFSSVSVHSSLLVPPLIYHLTSHPPRLYAALVKQTSVSCPHLLASCPKMNRVFCHHPDHRDLISTMAVICWSQVLPAHKWHHICSLKSASVEMFISARNWQTLPIKPYSAVPVKSQLLLGTLVGCGQMRNTVPDLTYRSQKRCLFSFWIANRSVPMLNALLHCEPLQKDFNPRRDER